MSLAPDYAQHPASTPSPEELSRARRYLVRGPDLVLAHFTVPSGDDGDDRAARLKDAWRIEFPDMEQVSNIPPSGRAGPVLDTSDRPRTHTLWTARQARRIEKTLRRNEPFRVALGVARGLMSFRSPRELSRALRDAIAGAASFIPTC